MDLAEFVAHYWYQDDTKETIDHVREMLAHPGVYSEGIPDNGTVLIYLTLDDEGLRILKSAKKPEDFKRGFTESLLEHPGRHIYVFRMAVDGKPTLQHLRALRSRVLRKHDALSFSWHDNNHVLLHTHEV